jgi:hypothetical protein
LALHVHLRQRDRDENDPEPESGGGVDLAPPPRRSKPPANPRIRPSLRSFQRRDPFTEREIIVFLNILRRTSFRRNTKSFKRWLKRMCVPEVE